MSSREEREYLQDDRDYFNRALAIESSWLCDMLRPLNIKEKQKILRHLITDYKNIKMQIQSKKEGLSSTS